MALTSAAGKMYNRHNDDYTVGCLSFFNKACPAQYVLAYSVSKLQLKPFLILGAIGTLSFISHR